MISAGIDFGTTNSSAAIVTDGQPQMVPLEQELVTIPTALYFADGCKIVYFGREAQNQYTNGDMTGRFMRSIKRILGSSLMKGAGTQISNRFMKFDKIIELFIVHLKNKIDLAAGENVENVVLGRPVHFRDNDPTGDAAAEEELRQIATNSGFKNIAFQYEPIAAAFAHERLVNAEKLGIVVDIGGGTSDFTVIRLSPERGNCLDRSSDILASTGISIGGNDFDEALSMKSFMPEFGRDTEIGGKGSYEKIMTIPSSPFFDLSRWTSINDLYTYKSLDKIKSYLIQSRSPEKVRRLLEIVENHLGHKNLEYVENAKIRLSDETEIQMVLDFISDTPTISSTRASFESAISDDVKKIRSSIEECVKLAGVKNSDIDLVILTGGSTEIPHISKIMQTYFPNAELSVSDKFSSVGLGLAYDSMRRFWIDYEKKNIINGNFSSKTR